MEVDAIIDGLTDCLLCTETGERHNTGFFLRTKKITKQESWMLKQQGWKFDWSIPQQNGYDVYVLFVEDSDVVQGMIALKHIPGQFYTHVDIVEAAPVNVGKNGKYKGVGAHLFAIACKLSWEAGNGGYVQFTAKTDLISHYMKMLNAKCIDWHTMYIDASASLELVNKYFNKGESYDCT